MRIIAGEYGGRPIRAPQGEATRPTTDRVRESMFSSLGSRIELEGAYVLDAFAGSGAIGIEALSRGAAHCTFFESGAKARRIIQDNLDALKIAHSQYLLVGSDVFAAAARPLRSTAAFDIVVLDPPYACDPEEVFGLLANLAANGDLAPDCVIAYEHTLTNSRETAALVEASELFELDGKQKKYGKVAVSYLRLAKGER